MKLWVVLALLAGPLAAQSVRSRLEGRVPNSVIPTIDSLVQSAAQEGLPTEPLIQKAIEGGAKHIEGPRIVAAVQVSLGQLRGARDLLVRAGDAPPVQPAEVTTVAWALRRGLPTAVVERVAAALPRPPRSPALHAVADLVAHRFEPDSAATLIIDAVQAGVPQDRLLDVSTATLHEVQRGRNRFEALATVRQLLPNVPAPAKPAHGAVAGARRPAPTPP
ncbi:MAG: hypothetical protein DMD34_13640 [Gemmatimonadetes bacterium]|nr:MAG: hypothetical protein DMD46_08200 [Gemmatimonadota bacterium]PYP92737.1 MAG: hypothetical protein DMD34_13640 [Gemmatimonadota bacterium]